MENKEDKSDFNLLYHYNPYTGTYNCFSRDDMVRYFNGSQNSRFSNFENREFIIGTSTSSFEDAKLNYSTAQKS